MDKTSPLPTLDALSRAAHPTLLDATREPEVLIAIVLANLMSPALWRFRERIAERMERDRPEGGGEPEALIMDEIQRYVNGHLFHLDPFDIESIWGLLDLDEERDRLGAEVVDYAIGSIRRNLERRAELGILKERQNLLPMIDAGKFPEYEYGNIDVILAHRRHLKRAKHKPLGITSCADEATLISSLACVLDGVSFNELLIIGAPVHYTPFVRRDGAAFWFNGKREWFDRRRWAELTTGEDGLSPARAFELRSSVDRLITPAGTQLFPTHTCSLSRERSEAIFAELASFFGVELPEIAEARRAGFDYRRHPLQGMSFAGVDEIDGPEDARERIRELARAHPGTVLELALYAYRDIDVPRPRAYLEAALRGFKLRQLAADVTRLDQALDVLRDVKGDSSIFDTRDRIALPDEVLLFGTASDRERALLLYCLLHLAENLDEHEARGLELLSTEFASYVRAGSRLIDAETLEEVAAPRGSVCLRLG